MEVCRAVAHVIMFEHLKMHCSNVGHCLSSSCLKGTCQNVVVSHESVGVKAVAPAEDFDMKLVGTQSNEAQFACRNST